MMTHQSGAAVEKLDRMYYCANCRMVFLFKADVQDHTASHVGCKINEMAFD